MKWSWRIATLLAVNAIAVAAVPLMLREIARRSETLAPALGRAGTGAVDLLFVATWVLFGIVIGSMQVNALRRRRGLPGLALAMLPLLALVLISGWRLSRATLAVAKASGYYVFSAAGLATLAVAIAAAVSSAYVLVMLWRDSNRREKGLRATPDRGV